MKDTASWESKQRNFKTELSTQHVQASLPADNRTSSHCCRTKPISNHIPVGVAPSRLVSNPRFCCAMRRALFPLVDEKVAILPVVEVKVHERTTERWHTSKLASKCLYRIIVMTKRNLGFFEEAKRTGEGGSPSESSKESGGRIGQDHGHSGRLADRNGVVNETASTKTLNAVEIAEKRD